MSEEISEHGEGSHNDKRIFRFQIFSYSIVHEDAHFLSRFDEEGSEEVGNLFQIEIGGLAEVDGQDMGEGGIVAECLKVDQFD